MKDGKKRILITDDEKEIREILNLLLSSEGYATVLAADGLEAASLRGAVFGALFLMLLRPISAPSPGASTATGWACTAFAASPSSTAGRCG